MAQHFSKPPFIDSKFDQSFYARGLWRVGVRVVLGRAGNGHLAKDANYHLCRSAYLHLP